MTRLLSSCTALLALSLFACNGHKSTASAKSAGIPGRFADSAAGTYVGRYSKGLITLVINYISGNIASGYDIHKGLRRNLNGQVEQNGAQLNFILKEPGGNPYDGTFFLSFDTATNKLSGKWVPTDSTKAKAGPLQLARQGEDRDRVEYDGAWNGDLGALIFHQEGVCTLEYYPNRGDNSQQVTVKGSYEAKGDTLRIDWQRNDRTPTLNMRLIRKKGAEATDSTGPGPRRLVGNGVEFVENVSEAG